MYWQSVHQLSRLQHGTRVRWVQEMKELAALAYRDTTAENREFWKNEMGQALREIQGVYDEKLESMRSEMETFYNLKVTVTNVAATDGVTILFPLKKLRHF